MLNKILNKKNKDEQTGFTIIEVLIVLAIAGLILVVVLIAIPQLQRNQRNSARQNEAARVATSISNWVANNNGATIPTSGSEVTDFLEAIVSDVGDLSQYDLTDESGDVQNLSVIVYSDSVEALPEATDTPLNEMRIVTQAECDLNGDVTQGVNREYVVQYATETTGAAQGQCSGV